MADPIAPELPHTLLVDYAEVVTFAQPAAAIAAMARLLGLDSGTFVERYWHHRPPYDRGGPPGAFWSAVADAEVDDAGLLAELGRLDVGSWTHLNPDTLDVLGAAQDRGHQLALFSNAPQDLAGAVREQREMRLFDALVFSSEIGLSKPDPAAFAAALQRLGRRPEDVLFIDDRAPNVAGAERAGLRALRFLSPRQLADVLLG